MPETVINIRAVDQASGAIRGVAGALGSIKNVVGGLALGAARVALDNLGTAARMAWDALNEGAALEATERRFESLAAGIGTTAAALDAQMAAASQGMMSDAQQMALAGDVIELGLADSGAEVARLSVLIDELGWNTSSLARTMATDSAAGVTALGLSLDDVRAKTEAYTAAGVAAGEAFDLAVIEAGEEKLESYGSAVDSTADKIQQLTVIWQDAVDAFKQDFATGVSEGLGQVADAASDVGPAIQEGMSVWGGEFGGWLGNMLAGAASEGLQRQTDALKDQLRELGVSAQELRDLEREVTDRPLPFIYDAQEGIRYYTDLKTALEETYGVQLHAADAALAWANDLAAAEAQAKATGGAADKSGRQLSEWTDEAKSAAIAAGELAGELAGIDLDSVAGATQSGIWKVAGNHIQNILDEAAAAANEEAQQLADEQAAIAAEIAAAYDEAAGHIADSFVAALQPKGEMDFGDTGAMAESAWNMAQAFDLTAVQIGQIGIAIGEITPEMAEAAAKAAIFQEAWGSLLGQFGAGNIDTTQLMAAYDQLISDLQSKSLVEIQVDLQFAAQQNATASAAEAWANDLWGGEAAVSVPIEFTPEQAALSQAIDLLDGIPANTEKLVTFGAEYTDVTEVAIPAIETAITAIDATVLMVPETAELDDKIELINESRLTMYVDFVAGEIPVPPGRAAGGPVTGGAAYVIGEAGPELFVPWTSGTVVPNHRITQGGGGGDFSVTMNFYGPTSAADVRRATDDAGRRLLEKARRAGLPV